MSVTRRVLSRAAVVLLCIFAVIISAGFLHFTPGITAQPLSSASLPQWQALPSPGAGLALVEMAVLPGIVQDTVFVLGWDGAFKLRRFQDGTWQSLLVSGGDVVSLDHVCVTPAGFVAVSGMSLTGPALWIAPPGGSFVKRSSPCAVDLLEMTADGTTLVLAGYTGGTAVIYVSADLGRTFSSPVACGSVPLGALTSSPAFAADGRLAVAAGDGGLWLSSDRGVSFNRRDIPLSGPVDIGFDAAFNSSGKLYFTAEIGGGLCSLSIPSEEWRQICAGAAHSPLSVGGVLYTADYRPADGVNIQGGLRRCLTDGVGTLTLNQGLSPGATLWQIAAGSGRVWGMDTTANLLFYIDDTAVNAPLLLAPPSPSLRIGVPLAGSKIGGIEIVWEEMPAAGNYRWQFSPLADFSVIPSGLTAETAENSAIVNGLDPLTLYHWRVRVEGALPGPWSEARVILTAAWSLGAVQLSAPASGAIVPEIRPRFNWQALAGATRYQIQVSTFVDFTDLLFNRETVAAEWTATSNLAYSTAYFWRVRAIAPCEGEWSVIWNFTTVGDNIGVPQPESPFDGTTGVALKPVFSWSAVTGATSYELVVSDRADFAALSIQHTTSARSWASTKSLENGRRYFWRVRALKNGVVGDWSNVFSFDTIPAASSTTTVLTAIPTSIVPTPPKITAASTTATSITAINTAGVASTTTLASSLPVNAAQVEADRSSLYIGLIAVGGVMLAVSLALFYMTTGRRGGR